MLRFGDVFLLAETWRPGLPAHDPPWLDSMLLDAEQSRDLLWTELVEDLREREIDNRFGINSYTNIYKDKD